MTDAADFTADLAIEEVTTELGAFHRGFWKSVE
jgi:hypothetical protein